MSRVFGAFKRMWDSPIGLKTTHFWGPFANWSIGLAGLADYDRPPEKVSLPMTIALAAYSAVFMRFALQVKPRNLLLFSCHVFNESVQLYHLTRKVKYEMNKPTSDVTLDNATESSAAVPITEVSVDKKE
ncbi:hypothetical protein ABK040_000966 [Willaertia magna]